MTLLTIASLLLNIFLAFCGYYLSSELDKCKQENNRLNELLAIPVPTMETFVTNYKVQNFCVKRTIPAEEARLYGEEYRELTKKQMTRELAESLVSNGFVEFIAVTEPGMGETITARIEVMQR